MMRRMCWGLAIGHLIIFVLGLPSRDAYTSLLIGEIAYLWAWIAHSAAGRAK